MYWFSQGQSMFIFTAEERVLHQCHLCAKTFSTKGGLKCHLAVHENLRQYKCTECDKAFNLKQVSVGKTT